MEYEFRINVETIMSKNLETFNALTNKGKIYKLKTVIEMLFREQKVKVLETRVKEL